MEIPDSIFRTFFTVKQFWGKAYQRLRFDTQEKEGRNPNKKEQEEIFLPIFDRHHRSEDYKGVTRENLFKLFEYFKNPPKKKSFVDPNQTSLVLTDSDSSLSSRRNLTGSLDEEFRVTTGFDASRSTKKYKNIRKSRF